MDAPAGTPWGVLELVLDEPVVDEPVVEESPDWLPEPDEGEPEDGMLGGSAGCVAGVCGREALLVDAAPPHPAETSSTTITDNSSHE